MEMSYYFTKTVSQSFGGAVAKVVDELKQEGFGIITEIDVQETIERNLDVDFRKYRILGACNPALAYQALQAEDNIGLLLPCNVIVQEKSEGQVEVSATDPLETMKAVNNPSLSAVAQEVQTKLKQVIDRV